MSVTKHSMEERLRAERPAHAAPAGFAERVMANLPERREETDLPPERVRLFWPRIALQCAVVILCASFAFQFFRPEPRSDASVVPQANIAPVASSSATMEPAEADFAFSQITGEQLQALTLKLDQPLDKELKNVISDTRQAIQFVASNFLPEK